MRSPFQSVVYLQIRRRWLSVRVLSWSGGDFRWHGTPEVFLASNRRGEPVAIDPDTARTNPTLNGRWFVAFAHPRCLLDGYDGTVLAIRNCIERSGYRFGRVRPLFLVHVRDKWEGGLSDVEVKGLASVCASAGAGEVRFIEEATELLPPRILELARTRQTIVQDRLPSTSL